MKKENYVWALLRVCLGLIFFWSFFDKVFGLGFDTEYGKAWINGVLPAQGFLQFGAHGPLAAFYASIASSQIVAWLFIIGLFCIGLALILGIGMRIAAYTGALMMILMWSALLPPAHHPFLDEHVVYAILLFGLMQVKAGRYFGLGKWWSKTSIVKRYKLLE